MRTIQVDDEVYRLLQDEAVPFEETPGETFKRLLLHCLNQPGRAAPVSRKRRSPRPTSKSTEHAKTVHRSKRPKANLEKLVASGALKSGEILDLRDYRNRPVAGCHASVSGNGLRFDGQRYSMSELAKLLLKQHGYESKAVRGPLFWFTKAGKSINDLWLDQSR